MDELQRSLALAAIKRHYLFATLSDAELTRLVDSVRLYELGPEEFLFRQDDEAERFFLLADGQIKLCKNAPDGNEKVVEIITPGQTIAEAVMFMQRHRFPVSGQIIKASRIYGIHCNTYMEILKDNMDSCIRILGDLSMRLHARLNDVVNLTQQNATFRVLRFLMNQLPHDAVDGTVIYLNTPKQVIASRLSVKPETLSRIMSSLAQQGIIEVKGREICVKDIARLCKYE